MSILTCIAIVVRQPGAERQMKVINEWRSAPFGIAILGICVGGHHKNHRDIWKHIYYLLEIHLRRGILRMTESTAGRGARERKENKTSSGSEKEFGPDRHNGHTKCG